MDDVLGVIALSGARRVTRHPEPAAGARRSPAQLVVLLHEQGTEPGGGGDDGTRQPAGPRPDHEHVAGSLRRWFGRRPEVTPELRALVISDLEARH